MDQYTQKELVRVRYGGIAEAASSASCCAPAASCCGPTADPVSVPMNRPDPSTDCDPRCDPLAT